MKQIISVTAALLWGCLLAFFGVFVSVFSDGGAQERAITIAVILGIYSVSGILWGYGGTNKTWQKTGVLSAPGVVLLLLYSVREIGLLPYFLLYGAGITACTWAGVRLGMRLRTYRRN